MDENIQLFLSAERDNNMLKIKRKKTQWKYIRKDKSYIQVQ